MNVFPAEIFGGEGAQPRLVMDALGDLRNGHAVFRFGEHIRQGPALPGHIPDGAFVGGVDDRDVGETLLGLGDGDDAGQLVVQLEHGSDLDDVRAAHPFHRPLVQHDGIGLQHIFEPAFQDFGRASDERRGFQSREGDLVIVSVGEARA